MYQRPIFGRTGVQMLLPRRAAGFMNTQKLPRRRSLVRGNCCDIPAGAQARGLEQTYRKPNGPASSVSAGTIFSGAVSTCIGT